MSNKAINAPKRRAVFAMTAGHCFYCGNPLQPEFGSMREAHGRDWLIPSSSAGMAIDHRDPTQRGGSNDLQNLSPACGGCNSRKSLSTVEEFRLRMGLREGVLPFRFAYDNPPLPGRDYIVVVSPEYMRDLIVHNFPNAYGHRIYGGWGR